MPPPLRFAQFEVELTPEGKPVELGRGGMGVTYKAFDTRLRRPVVVKVIHDGLLADETVRHRFQREARSAARVNHPGIAMVYDQGEEGGTFYYAMEFIRGETLQSHIEKSGPVPVEMALEIALQVTKALQRTWAEKVIHRDIKPSNVMLVRDAADSGDLFIKLIDFGLAKAISSGAAGEGSMAVSAAGMQTMGFIGTPMYASPEQINPEAFGLTFDDVDIRTDIYALGVTLWFALQGKPPFRGSSFMHLALQVIQRQPPYEELSHVSESVRALLRRMLAKDRDERPADPTALRRLLEECLREVRQPGSSPHPGANPADSGARISTPVSPLSFAATVPVSPPSGVPPPLPPPLPPPRPLTVPPPLPQSNPGTRDLSKPPPLPQMSPRPAPRLPPIPPGLEPPGTKP